jgi:hypothetical protein
MLGIGRGFQVGKAMGVADGSAPVGDSACSQQSLLGFVRQIGRHALSWTLANFRCSGSSDIAAISDPNHPSIR